jgi:hypothetical protein
MCNRINAFERGRSAVAGHARVKGLMSHLPMGSFQQIPYAGVHRRLVGPPSAPSGALQLYQLSL